MSGWIDPLGLHILRSHLQAEQALVTERAEEAERFGSRRKIAKFRGRQDQISRIIALIESVVRPAVELKPYKDLVQSGNVRDRKK